jgi:septal ring factor EnvC (AmiA/AmiB activator)
VRDNSKLTQEEREATNEKMRRLTKKATKRRARKMGRIGKKIGGALSRVASPILNRFGQKLPKRGYKIEKSWGFGK